MFMRTLIDLCESFSADTTATPAERFEDAFYAQFDPSDLAGRVRVSLHYHGDDAVEISHIQTAPDARGQGLASRAIAMLTAAADEISVVLYASPATDADSENGLDPGELRDWYERHGFRSQGGVDAMRRRPRRAKV